MIRSGPDDLRRLDALLRAWIKSDEGYALLDADPETRGGSWLAGGCAVLAVALCRWSWARLILAAVVDSAGRPQHYVATFGDFVIDGDGVSSLRSLITRWRGAEGIAGARLVIRSPQHPIVIDGSDGIPLPTRLVEIVKSKMNYTLGLPRAYPSLGAS